MTKDANGEVVFEANADEGKAYSFGPAYKFNGKVIPCLVYVSKSGGITAEIIVEVLSELDIVRFSRARRTIHPAPLEGVSWCAMRNKSVTSWRLFGTELIGKD